MTRQGILLKCKDSTWVDHKTFLILNCKKMLHSINAGSNSRKFSKIKKFSMIGRKYCPLINSKIETP